jgi:HK97 gp10 family phage protein
MASNRFANKARVLQRMAQLPSAIKDAVRIAQQQNAAELTAAIKGAAPVDTGDLRDSVRAWKEGETVPSGTLSAGGSGETLPELAFAVTAGDDKAFYARWVEFGTVAGRVGGVTRNASGRVRKVYRDHPGTAAQPFFYPIYRSLKKRLLNRVARAAGKGARKAAGGG